MPENTTDQSLSKGLSGSRVNFSLLAQAVRVHLANQRQGTQKAKTRAEINRTRKKLYKQKGTGGARHGDRRSPIFVGGGVVFAPRPRSYSRSLSKSMKNAALRSAWSVAAADKKVQAISFPDSISKTAQLAKFLHTQDADCRSWLLVTAQPEPRLVRAVRNIPGVRILPRSGLNAYELLRAQKVLVEKDVVKPVEPSTKSKVAPELKTKSRTTAAGPKKSIKKS